MAYNIFPTNRIDRLDHFPLNSFILFLEIFIIKPSNTLLLLISHCNLKIKFYYVCHFILNTYFKISLSLHSSKLTTCSTEVCFLFF